MFYLLGLLACLQFMDGLMTHLSVSTGLVHEINPFVSALAQQGIFPILKLAGAVVCVLVLWILGKRFPRLSTATAYTLVAFYTIVIGWNLHSLLTVA